MIATLRGTLARKETGHIVIDVQGVGYLVHIPYSTFFALGEVGTEVSLLVHTHVREDALQLFGFSSALEQQVFSRLIEVSGIGPKMAQSILSGIPARELIDALRGNDLRRLMAVPGLGKKTSERLVVELRDRLDAIRPDEGEGPRPPRTNDASDDAVSALVNLGYRLKDCESAVARVAPRTDGTLEAILKAALALVAG